MTPEEAIRYRDTCIERINELRSLLVQWEAAYERINGYIPYPPHVPKPGELFMTWRRARWGGRADIAPALGVTKETVARWERGERTLPVLVWEHMRDPRFNKRTRRANLYAGIVGDHYAEED